MWSISLDDTIKYLVPTEEYWVIDIEADSLKPTRVWCAVVQNVITEELLAFLTMAELRDWFNQAPRVLVGHNILSFDGPVLNRLWRAGIDLHRCVDTLVLSFLDHPQRPDGHALDAWGVRLGSAKLNFNKWDQFSQEMLEYCVQDVKLTRLLYLHLCQIMEDFSEESAEIEHRTRIIIDRMQDRGVLFDVEGARRLYDTLRERERVLGEQIHSVFPPKLVVAGVYAYRTKKDGTPYSSYLRHVERYERVQFNRSGTQYRVFERRPFNIGSPTQRVERLLELGWKPTQFTPKGNPKVDEESLLAFSETDETGASKSMAEWLVCNGRANMINNWLEAVDTHDNRIRPRVFSCGAGTRRMRHTQPNTANIPGIHAPYGPECRALWTVGAGRKLVGCDAERLEALVLVHYLGNESAAKYFLEGDAHQANADAIGCERGPGKNIFYAFLYGASDRKLGSMVGAGAKRGAEIRQALIKNIPGLEVLVESVTTEFNENNGRLQTVDGGYVRCPSVHAALNYKFQSAGAILMKKAGILLESYLDDVNYSAFRVLDVHDEWQYDVAEDEADLAGGLMVKSIQDAGRALKFNVPMNGAYIVGNNWAETH